MLFRSALDLLTNDVYMELMARTRRVSGVLRDACAAAGLTVQFPVVGTLMGMYFGSGDLPTNFDEAKTTNEREFAAFFQAGLAEGIAFAPGAYEAVFVGLGHDDVVIDELAVLVNAAATRAVASLG